MNLLSSSKRYDLAKSQTEIAKYQRFAVSAAVLTQVHVAVRDFSSRKRQFEISAQLQDIDSRIYEQVLNQKSSGIQNHLNEIRAAIASLMASYRKFQSYAALQNSYGQIMATLGEDPLPETVTSYDIQSLSDSIAVKLNSLMDFDKAPIQKEIN